MDNQVRLQLFAMAYNMGNFLRRLALPNQIKDWSLRTMREKLVKIGARVVSHARYVTFQMAELLVSKSLFHEILERINHLKPDFCKNYSGRTEKIMFCKVMVMTCGRWLSPAQKLALKAELAEYTKPAKSV